MHLSLSPTFVTALITWAVSLHWSIRCWTCIHFLWVDIFSLSIPPCNAMMRILQEWGGDAVIPCKCKPYPMTSTPAKCQSSNNKLLMNQYGSQCLPPHSNVRGSLKVGYIYLIWDRCPLHSRGGTIFQKSFSKNRYKDKRKS